MASDTQKGLSSRMRRVIEKFGPYQSLVLLAVPLCIVEPMKLVPVAIAGEGHWFKGTVVIIVACAASLFLIHRLFRIVKPKLLQMSWFVGLWSWIIRIRYRLMKPLRSAN